MDPHKTRREFLLHASGAAGAAWLSAQWPMVVAAAQHAHEAAKQGGSSTLEVLSPEQARQIEAIASQIIPSDDLPGAREAGVVYFVDRALKTFASADLSIYEKGLAHLQQLTTTKYSGAKSFADATDEEQEAVLAELAGEKSASEDGMRIGPGDHSEFFQTIRTHTIYGFLAAPSAGGNRNYAGWKVVDRDPAFSFAPPYGFYDKDYPGWEAAKEQTEKK